MTSAQSDPALKQALAARRPVVGSFVRGPSAATVEIFGLAGLDFVCLDAEHGVFDRDGLDRCILAARAQGIASLVRVPAADAPALMQPLDMGATGVVVPHIRDADAARDAVRLSHFGAGGRGFAASPRAAGYGIRTRVQHIADSRDSTCVLAMLEDPDAFEALDAILAVDGLDGVVLGLSDLTVALGAVSPRDERVQAAATEACAAARRHGRSLGAVVPGIDEVRAWQERGASFFLVGSDQGFLMDHAAQAARGFAGLR